jgi:hypothetical protein
MENEFPNQRQNIKFFQIETGEFPGQDSNALLQGAAGVNNNHIPAQEFAAPAGNGEFFVGKIFITDIDFKLGGNTLQILEHGWIREEGNHDLPECPFFERKRPISL